MFFIVENTVLKDMLIPTSVLDRCLMTDIVLTALPSPLESGPQERNLSSGRPLPLPVLPVLSLFVAEVGGP